MSEDLIGLLRDWPLGDDNVRRIVGDDGREKVQIRVCINSYHGILQFDCDGRPDGARPHGRDFALDYHEDEFRQHRDAFHLSHEQAEALFEESTMTYQRYIVLLQMNDYRRVIHDTERNMRLFRFMHQHASEEDDRNALEKWWPYIIRIHAAAKAMDMRQNGDFAAALELVRAARREIEALAEQDDEVFRSERERSYRALDELEQLINEQRPLSQIERLERLRDEAIREEKYELAARLRDRINALREQEQNQE
jgi:hypothetical protein